jgi:hypothetical protein
LLAHRRAADLQGDQQLVCGGEPFQGPHGRNRFWGAPIPVWRSDDPAYPRIDVYGSIEELERDFGVKVDNLHRPMVDDLVRSNPKTIRPARA